MKKNRFDDFDDNEDNAFGSRIKESFEKFFKDLDQEDKIDEFSHIFNKNKTNKEKPLNSLEPIQTLNELGQTKNNEPSINEALNKITNSSTTQDFKNQKSINNNSLNKAEPLIETNNTSKIEDFQNPNINKIIDNFDFNQKNEPNNSKKFNMVYSKKDKQKEINNELSLELDTIEFLEENNLSISKIRSIIEGTLYVMGSNGLNLVEIQKLVNLPLKILKNILEQMMHEKEVDVNSGLCIKLYGSTYKLLSKESIYFDICKILNKNETKPFSKSKLEILSIIAYNQPCTKKVIESIRGKDPTHALYSLMELGIIEKHNRSNEPGNPNLYVVTELFFDLFGIKSLSELPKIKPESENLIQNIISSIDE